MKFTIFVKVIENGIKAGVAIVPSNVELEYKDGYKFIDIINLSEELGKEYLKSLKEKTRPPKEIRKISAKYLREFVGKYNSN